LALNNQIESVERRHSIAYVGTYPPKECGIATFTMDVVNSTDLSGWQSVVFAVDDVEIGTVYNDPKVRYVIDKDNQQSYLDAVALMHKQGVSLLSIQHEYGIYGGEEGSYIIELAKAARCPVVITLHTILPQPTAQQLKIIKELEPYCDYFITMAHKGKRLLQEVYDIAPEKIVYIPHGTPNMSFVCDAKLRRQYDLEGRRVLATFGLIGPNKGIEDAIAAMPAIVERDPTAIYLVLGQTHPVIKRREGEWYRNQLVQQVKDLGLENNVRFIDRYLDLQQLLDYLLLTDIYITPYYANPFQITSGTLSYALAAGKVIISTPYLHAVEILAEGRGFLYPFRDSAKLAELTCNLLTDHKLFEATRQRAYKHGRQMTWQSVGMQYTRMFSSLLKDEWVNTRVLKDAQTLMDLNQPMAMI
jgi:glycosyltransferase involved in cell wall biosynthesis